MGVIPETTLTMPNLRPSLSDIQPKVNMPTSMPKGDISELGRK